MARTLITTLAQPAATTQAAPQFTASAGATAATTAPSALADPWSAVPASLETSGAWHSVFAGSGADPGMGAWSGADIAPLPAGMVGLEAAWAGVGAELHHPWSGGF